MGYKFDEEGSPMWVWRFHLLIDGKPYRALIHAYNYERAIKRLNILARKSKIHGHYIRDVHEQEVIEEDGGLFDDENPAHKEYLVRLFY